MAVVRGYLEGVSMENPFSQVTLKIHNLKDSFLAGACTPGNLEAGLKVCRVFAIGGWSYLASHLREFLDPPHCDVYVVCASREMLQCHSSKEGLVSLYEGTE